ncbi:irregular chiasm C-roughest protein [Caerostris extrusa]|uniref:Irregular chiasm C-roughest protein n=1 Tax=Caerostris extrusa TaxID=172846 RepID=A0AAV4RW90_CAEEX|nr:irregular chiasm C-roughest protein [Caerostris extrusa]
MIYCSEFVRKQLWREWKAASGICHRTSRQDSNRGQTCRPAMSVLNKVGTLQWTRDGFGLGSDRELRGFPRYTMVGSDDEGDFSLHISSVTLEDNAMFQCQVGAADGVAGIRSRNAAFTVFGMAMHMEISIPSYSYVFGITYCSITGITYHPLQKIKPLPHSQINHIERAISATVVPSLIPSTCNHVPSPNIYPVKFSKN